MTRNGWGEFPIHVQIHFKDPRNKRVDICHQLKLDWTQTGLQTFGGETCQQVELQLKKSDQLLHAPPPLPPPPPLSLLKSDEDSGGDAGDHAATTSKRAATAEATAGLGAAHKRLAVQNAELQQNQTATAAQPSTPKLVACFSRLNTYNQHSNSQQ